jgi:hypothetical protein
MCLRTGPWDKYIIMTNCDYTRHQGIKTEKDISICLKTLQNINKDNWLKMCNVTANKLGMEENSLQSSVQDSQQIKEELILPIKKDKSKKQPKISNEQLRNIRISFFDKKEDNEK